MQLLHVTALWFRLAGNVLFDLFLYVRLHVRPLLYANIDKPELLRQNQHANSHNKF